MFDFGDDLVLQSFRIPWLLWIQLIIVLLLLLAFLFCFTIFASDPSPDTVAASASTIQTNPNHHSTVIANALHSTREVENLSIKAEIVARRGSRGIVREEFAVAAEGEASSSSLYFLHPCYYFKLARVAFLKCLGLDSTSESDSPPPTQKHRKKKES